MFTKQWTVVFLGDAQPPSRLICLRRANWKKFQPGRYTGIGGKIEPGEEPLAGAERELAEEVADFRGIPLTEVGRLIVNGAYFLGYFAGQANPDRLPSCTEGTLAWVALADISRLDFIPTTKAFLEIWARRKWALTPFTVRAQRQPLEDPDAPLRELTISDGLGQ